MEIALGPLVQGRWETGRLIASGSGGRFQRATTAYRNRITPDGSPGPTGRGGLAAESGRYHLHVSLARPWAYRTLIFRAIKGLTDHISVDVVHPDMGEDGWTLDADYPGATCDRLHGRAFRRDVCTAADPSASGRVTVPVLLDKPQDTIVSNESAEIIRMPNSAFDRVTGNTDDQWPEVLRPAIDAVKARI
jgi:putative glutathione S-transferase